MYTSDHIEEAIIVRDVSNTNGKESSRNHFWNDEDHAFGYQVDQWGVEKLFQNSDELLIRKLKMYVEYREN